MEVLTSHRRPRGGSAPTPRFSSALVITSPPPSYFQALAPAAAPELTVDTITPTWNADPEFAAHDSPALALAPAPLVDLTEVESGCWRSSWLRILRRAAEDPCIGIAWALELVPPLRVITAAEASILHIDAERRRLEPCSFKIGATSDPYRRWHKAGWGYAPQGWWSMQVLWDANGEEVRSLERRLIRHYRGDDSCRNIAPGGEGVTADTCFVYVVFFPLAVEMRSARKK